MMSIFSKDPASRPNPPEPPPALDGLRPGLGATLSQAREAKGLSLAALARELRMPQHLLDAIENENWDKVPPGRQRPLVLRIAEHLELDPGALDATWKHVPSNIPVQTPHPKRAKLERLFTFLLGIGSIFLLFWLLVPVRKLKSDEKAIHMPIPERVTTLWVPQKKPGPFPVMGELIPEKPINEEGILVILRALEPCQALILSQGTTQRHPLHVSVPINLRVKGPFSLNLDRAGSVKVEVAGKRISHGRSILESWTGEFDDLGNWMLPKTTEKPIVKEALDAPEAEESSESEE